MELSVVGSLRFRQATFIILILVSKLAILIYFSLHALLFLSLIFPFSCTFLNHCISLGGFLLHIPNPISSRPGVNLPCRSAGPSSRARRPR